MSALEETLADLLGGVARHGTVCFGDWDADRERIDEAMRFLEQRLGPASFSGRAADAIARYALGRLHGDVSRSVTVRCWERGDTILVAMLTTHDAGTLTDLELEVAARDS